MLNISTKSEYALLFLSSLVGKNHYTPLSEMIKKTKLPQRFLARIAAQLVKNQVIESKEGKIGGYKLSDKIKFLTMYDFLKIFEGELSFVKCSEDDYCCRWEKICCQKNFLRDKLSKIIVKELKKLSLIELLRS